MALPRRAVAGKGSTSRWSTRCSWPEASDRPAGLDAAEQRRRRGVKEIAPVHYKKLIEEDPSNSLFKLRVIPVPMALLVICIRFALFVSRKEREGEYMEEEGKNG